VEKLAAVMSSGNLLALWLVQIGICAVAGIISGLVGADKLFILFAVLTFGSLFVIGLVISYLEHRLSK